MLYTAYTVHMFYTVNTVYIVYTVCTVYIVNSIQTALHYINSRMYAYLYIVIRSKRCWM